MHPKDLPVLGVPAPIVDDFVPLMGDIASKSVLCLGMSQDQIEFYVGRYQPARIVCLSLWEGHKDSQAGQYELVIGDITKRTEFADNTFDAVISHAVLEHLTPLEDGLLEMKRITKPGGALLPCFGPAWSSPYGHHMYDGSPGTDPAHFLFSHWKMPAYMHLLSAPWEIADYYKSLGYPDQLCEAPLQWFYKADHINRVMFDDYTRLFARHFGVERCAAMLHDVPDNLLALLRARFPGYIDFSTYGGAYRLRVAKEQ
jgi:SAM-dependent methyltransferase